MEHARDEKVAVAVTGTVVVKGNRNIPFAAERTLLLLDFKFASCAFCNFHDNAAEFIAVYLLKFQPVLLREELIRDGVDKNARIVIIMYLFKKSLQSVEPSESFHLVQLKLRLCNPQEVVRTAKQIGYRPHQSLICKDRSALDRHDRLVGILNVFVHDNSVKLPDALHEDVVFQVRVLVVRLDASF